jgi:hypothetical protein
LPGRKSKRVNSVPRKSTRIFSVKEIGEGLFRKTKRKSWKGNSATRKNLKRTTPQHDNSTRVYISPRSKIEEGLFRKTRKGNLAGFIQRERNPKR